MTMMDDPNKEPSQNNDSSPVAPDSSEDPSRNMQPKLDETMDSSTSNESSEANAKKDAEEEKKEKKDKKKKDKEKKKEKKDRKKSSNKKDSKATGNEAANGMNDSTPPEPTLPDPDKMGSESSGPNDCSRNVDSKDVKEEANTGSESKDLDSTNADCTSFVLVVKKEDPLGDKAGGTSRHVASRSSHVNKLGSLSSHTSSTSYSYTSDSCHSSKMALGGGSSTHTGANSRHKPCPVPRGVKKKDPLGKSSTHSSSGSAPRPAATSAMVGKGIKYGVREVTIDELAARTSQHTRDSFSGDDDEEFYDDDDDSSVGSIFWEAKEREIENPVLRRMYKSSVCCLITFKCMPKDPADSTPIKNSLRGMQWAALILDFAAALVAVFTFSGNTMCCGTPVLNVVGDAPWDNIIPIASYVYAGLILAEIYPVISFSFPFNIINPIFGCALTIAMFFDDSKVMALSMWALEAAAVLCECTIYVLKSMQKKQRLSEIARVAPLTKREREPDESIAEHEKDLKKVRRKYFQLKAEQKGEDKMLWYLGLANGINLVMIASMLVLIIFVSKAGGLCIDMDGGTIPNPFAADQFATCSQCDPDPSKPCEICTAEHSMCYYPYS